MPRPTFPMLPLLGSALVVALALACSSQRSLSDGPPQVSPAPSVDPEASAVPAGVTLDPVEPEVPPVVPGTGLYSLEVMLD